MYEILGNEIREYKLIKKKKKKKKEKKTPNKMH